MIILVEARWFRSQSDPTRYDYSEGIELRSAWPKPFGHWFIDRHSLKPRGWRQHYAVPAGNILSFAAVEHGTCACTLLLFSKSAIHTRDSMAPLSIAYDERTPQFMELGTVFDHVASRTMIDGLRKLDYRVDQYSWAEFLDRIDPSKK